MPQYEAVLERLDDQSRREVEEIAPPWHVSTIDTEAYGCCILCEHSMPGTRLEAMPTDNAVCRAGHV